MTATESAPTEVAARLADRFDEDGLAYALGGALALGAWGVPRTTTDVDIAVFVAEPELDKLLDSIERAGAMVDRAEAGRSVAKTGFLVAILAGPASICSSRTTLARGYEHPAPALADPGWKRALVSLA